MDVIYTLHKEKKNDSGRWSDLSMSVAEQGLKQCVSDLKFMTPRLHARYCGKQYQWSATALGKQDVFLCCLEAGHGCLYWPDIANKKKERDSVIFGQKHLILSSQLTSSPFSLVTTSSIWKCILVWSYRKSRATWNDEWMHVKHQLCKPSEDLQQEFDFYCGQTSRFWWWVGGCYCSIA